MFEQVSALLSDTIGRLEIPVDGAALVESFRHLDQLTARVVGAVGDFDQAEGWRGSGAVTLTSWLRIETGRSSRDAAAIVQTARRLRDLPGLAEAYRDGTLSTGQVQAIVANLNDDTAPLFADAEADLVPTLAAMPVKDASATMQTWAQAAKDSLHDPGNPEPKKPERRLHLSETLNGRRELSASLDPEAGALADTALRLAATDDVEGEPARSPATRRADALVDILRFFLDHQTGHESGRHRPHLNVHVDYDDLVNQADPTGWLLDGTVLDAATIRRLACDAGVNRVMLQGRSSILDYGRTTRAISRSLFNALVARDQHCRFPGCDRPPEWCEAHHVVAWEHGGETNPGNLVLGCTRHHHILHTPGWQAKLRPDGTLEITTPDGQILDSRPPGRPPDLFARRQENP